MSDSIRHLTRAEKASLVARLEKLIGDDVVPGVTTPWADIAESLARLRFKPLASLVYRVERLARQSFDEGEKQGLQGSLRMLPPRRPHIPPPPCLFENVDPNKVMHLSCPCPRCTPRY